ncbi:uncharacterized protein LODBEIA_P26230 [Lodderomyces beijingensis]|uniref:Protein kinase domain-containing protein n=1 Tax=Lodderomyces beijingensis TaxID=1775926 RepID=A0ABP0ZJS2_9ASCO
MLSSLGFKTGVRASYNVSDNPTFISEPWAIYPAKHRSSGRIVSVFIFDKSKFESQVHRLCSTSSNTTSPKKIIKECYELIKFEVGQLSKLKHPQILTIIEVLEETKTKFLFVSEPISGNLITANDKDLDSLSVQKGLLQVAKGLQFLHTQGNIIHLNIQPSSIYINNQGDWKLGGFKFLRNLNELSPQERDNFYIMNNSTVIPFANLNLNFTAPELIIDSQTKLDFANDIWSFGMLIFYVYNHPAMLIDSFDPSSIQDFKQNFRRFEQKFYNRQPVELKHILKDVPDKLHMLFPQLLARYPYDRLTLDQFIDSDFFNGSIIKAMWFIDEFSTKSIHEKLMFLKGLLEFDPETQSDLINQFPQTFRSSKLLPLLISVVLNELSVRDESTAIDPNVDELISYSLEIIMIISKNLAGLTFQDRVFNVLLKDNTSLSEKVYDAIFKDDSKGKKSSKIFTKLINTSVKTRLTLVNNLAVLQEKTNEKQFVGFIKHILELVFTLGSNEQDQKHVQIVLQEKFLDYMPTFISMIEFPYMKNTMFPLLCRIFQSTTVYSTKLKILDTFEAFCDQRVIDKIIIDEQLLPITRGITDRNREIVTKLINFFAKVVTSEHVNLDMKTAVDSVLPQCFSFAFGCTDCGQDDFKSYMKIINNVQQHLVENKLQQLPQVAHGVSNGDNASSFGTLLQNQAIKEPEKEPVGPKTKAMQPTKPPPAIRTNKKPLEKNQSIQLPTSSKRHLKPSQPKTATASTGTTINNNSSLSFGASSQSSNAANANILSKMKSTYETQDKDNEGFDEFQSATSLESSQANPSGGNKINWMSEVNKMKTLPTTPPLQKSTSSSLSSNGVKLQQNGTQPTVKYPPGFNSNSVLSPKSSTLTRTQPNLQKHQNSTTTTNNVNTDLLDLL